MKAEESLKQISESNIFLDWYDSQPSSARWAFYGAVIVALLTHAIIYLNLMLEEHMPGFTVTSNPLISGRWFHTPIHRLSFYYMNWTTGLIQVVFMALFVFILIKAFNIQNRLYGLLIAGIAVTFPTIAESNIYALLITLIPFAALLNIAAFYVTKLYKFGWIIGAFLIMLGLAIYQSNISFAMLASLIYLIIYVSQENPKFVELIKYASRYVLLIAIGFVLYYVSLQILDITPDYRGMGNLSLTAIYHDIWRAYKEVFYYFFSDTYRIDNPNLPLAYGFIVFMCLVLLVIVIKRLLNDSIINAASITMLALLLPLAANFSRILDAGGAYILGMTSYAFAFFLILPLILLENLEIDISIMNKFIVLAMVYIIGFNISFSNFIYQRGELMTIRVMHFTNRVATHVEPLLPYSTNNQVFLTGNIIANPLYPHMTDFTEFTPPRAMGRRMFGMDVIGLWPDMFLPEVIRHRIGLNINHVSTERRHYLIEQAITYGMPVYPQDGSVSLIDGVVVVMLNFFSRVDVEQPSPNSFIVIANHTGKATDLEFVYTWYLYSNGERLHEISPPENTSIIDYEIIEPGSYQFRVFVCFPDERNVINDFSPTFEVG